MSHTTVTLYALSTCVHCRHAREFLEQNQIGFACTYVDKLEGAPRQEALEEIRKVNPRLSFPTMVIGPEQVVVIGFNPEAIKEALG